MTFAKIQQFADHGIINSHSHPIINNPLVYSEHWPRAGPGELINFKDQTRQQYLSLYQGDFQSIGTQLYQLTDNFKDFTIVTNPPYGHQSAEKQRMSRNDTQNLYRRFGKFLASISSKDVRIPFGREIN